MTNRKRRDLDGATIQKLGFGVMTAGLALPLVLLTKGLEMIAKQEIPHESLLLIQLCIGATAVAVVAIGGWIWFRGAAKLEVEQRANGRKWLRPHTPRPATSSHTPAKRRR